MCFKMQYITDHIRGHDDKKIDEMGRKIIFICLCIHLKKYCIPSQTNVFHTLYLLAKQLCFLIILLLVKYIFLIIM